VNDDVLAEELRQAIGRLVRAAKSSDGLPPGEEAVLGLLDREGPQTIAALAQSRGVSHQSAAKSVKALLAEGLVRTEPHPADRRALLVQLTEAGRVRLAAERNRRAGTLGSAIAGALSAAERRQLRTGVDLLNKLTTHLQGR
jgi:DNA-binding MarR family transcriptional regulator